MDMSDNEYDCPQYVDFRNLPETPRLSVDSSNVPERSDMESVITGNLSSCSMESSDQTKDLTEDLPICNSKLYTNYVKSTTTLKVTVPKPFHFQTDNRMKNKTDGNSIHEKKDFVSELRQNIVLQPRTNRPTKQQPFKLTEAKKRKRGVDYVPLAEQISAFQKKTPERYHTSSHKDFQSQEHWDPPKLVPKSPKLQALKRRRVVQAVSREEQENKEIEEMKAYEFHARPVDPKIYKLPSTLKLLPMIKAKSKDYRLKTTQKAVMQLRNRKKSNKEKYQFKARPVPKGILSGPTGLKEKPIIHVTEPRAPAFKMESRLEKRKIHEEEKKIQELALIKEAKKQHHSVTAPSVPSVPYVKKRTEIQPFSFDKADKQRFAQKEKRIQEEIEKESKPYVFHAQLMPYPEPSSLPVVPKLPPTEVKPFNFLLENRSYKSSNLTFEANTTFKAQPATVLRKEPFVPEKLPKQIIEVKEFNLHTDKRASDRQHMKEIRDQEELEKEQALLERKAKEEERERQELLRHRKELVHKANPIRQYKPVEMKPYLLPLTEPKSPQFETDKRLRSRHEPSM